jgi:tryptophan halogenase
VQEAHLFQHLIWKEAGAPSLSCTASMCPPAASITPFHFDQALVGQWLRRKAKSIRLVDDVVTGVEKGGNGIAALHLKRASGRGDLFIDASGSAAGSSPKCPSTG